MQDPADTVTAELPLARKRGRPSTGKALTAAERKRIQRAREDAKLNEAFSTRDGLKALSTGHLLTELGRCMSGGYALQAQAILDEVQSRMPDVKKGGPRRSETPPKERSFS